MRSLPLTDKAGPGGRPRATRAPSNPFGEWLAGCGMKPGEVADALTKIIRANGDVRSRDWKLSISSIYNSRNAYFRPGRDLAVAIEQLTTDPQTGISAVPCSSWPATQLRPRKGETRKRARRAAKAA